MGRREAEREGGESEVAGDRRERGGNPAAFVFVPRPVWHPAGVMSWPSEECWSLAEGQLSELLSPC
jgi:hypothetical protein